MKFQKHCLDNSILHGWDVTRGHTWVKMNDGTEGIITEWYGGYFSLDGKDKQFYRDDVKEWRNENAYR